MPRDRISAITLCVSDATQNNRQTRCREKAGLGVCHAPHRSSKLHVLTQAYPAQVSLSISSPIVCKSEVQDTLEPDGVALEAALGVKLRQPP